MTIEAGRVDAEREWGEDERRRDAVRTGLARIQADRKRLRILGRVGDFDARLTDAEHRLAGRGFSADVLEEAPAGWRLLFVERAASLADLFDAQADGEVLDGCTGACARCPQRDWCPRGRSPDA
jgi:hypothetical protein